MICRLGRIAIILVILLSPNPTESSNILAITLYSFPSPYLVWKPYIQALVERGHQVTMVSSVGLVENIVGVRHIRIQQLDKEFNDILASNISSNFLTNKWIESSVKARLLYNITHAILNDEVFQQIRFHKSEHFDLIIMEPWHTYALFSLSKYFNAPLVGLAAFGPHWITEYLLGNLAPTVFEPVSPLGYSQGTDIWSRWQNWWHITEEWLLEWLIFWPSQVKLSKKFFGYPPPDVHGLFSLILINHHFSMGHVRSNVPNIIEVAGLHLSQPDDPCDNSLQRFLDEAEFGVIYFSMGFELQAKWLPKDMHLPLLQTFARLKQRVVWKYGLDSMPNKTDNIYLSKNVPQRQLLAHPNVKLFITHGGLLGIIESIFNGVPMLGLPLFFDQFKNMERMKRSGIAEYIENKTLSVDLLTTKIRQILENPRYAVKAKEISNRFTDQPINPLENAIWWTEYVLRHKGAPHMRLDEDNISFLRYYQIDTVALVVGRFALIAIIIILLCAILVSKLRGRSNR